MKSEKILNELSVSYPDGFSVMKEDELKKFFTEIINRWGIWHKSIHTIISFSRTKESTLLSFLTDNKAVAKGIETGFKKSLQNYQRKEEFIPLICGKKSYGISFTYTATDSNTLQYGKLIVFKNNKCFYVVHCMVGENYATQGFQALETVLNSITKQ